MFEAVACESSRLFVFINTFSLENSPKSCTFAVGKQWKDCLRPVSGLQQSLHFFKKKFQKNLEVSK